MKAWQKGVIIGTSYMILIFLIMTIVSAIHKGLPPETGFSKDILYLYFITFTYNGFLSVVVAAVVSLPPMILLSVLDLSQGPLFRFTGAITAAIGGLTFYMAIPLSFAIVGYVTDILKSKDGWKKEITKLKDWKSIKKCVIYFTILLTIFSILLYYPKPEVFIPKGHPDPVSSTPVFKVKSNELIPFPCTSFTLSIHDADTGEYIFAGSGGNYGGLYISPAFPLSDGRRLYLSVTEYRNFIKPVDFEVRETKYYFTVNMSQHPSPEELEIINFLIDSEIPEYGRRLNRPSEEELDTINKLRALGIPPHGTRLKDVNWIDFQPPWEEK